ncbi:MAG: sulfurtransferase TusA family protein [Leptolyngbya sp. DLM2.Bin15]|nr:MAG: sulfurtransferase TusA family protein [Leptolyngbya sp. DLM2.Bin15]
MSHASAPDSSTEHRLDLRGTPCPINFVRTKLYLQKIAPGDRLEVWLDPGEPIEQVPDSLRMEGYLVEAIEDRTEFFRVTVQRPLDIA